MDRSDMTARTYGQWWQFDGEMVEVSVEAVRELGLTLLRKAGAADDGAAFLVDMSLGKALQGDHTRGLESLCSLVRSGIRGEVDLDPSVSILRETPGTALV